MYSTYTWRKIPSVNNRHHLQKAYLCVISVFVCVCQTARQRQRTPSGHDGPPPREIYWTQTSPSTSMALYIYSRCCVCICKQIILRLFFIARVQTWFVFLLHQVNLVSNLTLAKGTVPKTTPSMSLSQSATAPSTPLTSLPQTPSVIIPTSLHSMGPIRKRYADKYNMAMDQGEKHITVLTDTFFFFGMRCAILTWNVWTSLSFLIDIVQNKEFYLSAEVRPPFTYAALIRQVRNHHLMRHHQPPFTEQTHFS